MWIKKEEKKSYNDCPIKGLRLLFFDDFSDKQKKKFKEYCDWIRKNYWFPIRCKLSLVNQKKFNSIIDNHKYYGVFYSNEESKRSKYPVVCVAAQAETVEELFDVYFTIAHELTHYFQWYFFEDDNKSDKSLEIMANKWASYIVDQYKEFLQTKQG